VSLSEDVNVKREALRLAERLYQDNKDKVEQGTLAPIEVTRAQAQVAVSRQALISAEGLVQQQELIVKTAITRRGLLIPVIPRSPRYRDGHADGSRDGSGATRRGLDRRGSAKPARFGSGRNPGANSEISLKGSLTLCGPNWCGWHCAEWRPFWSLKLRLRALTPGATFYPGGYGTELGQIFKNNFPTYSIASS